MTNRTTEEECPDCTGFDRCDYHEGVRHERERVETLLNDVEKELQLGPEFTECEDCTETAVCRYHAGASDMAGWFNKAVRRRLNHDNDDEG